MIRVKYDNIYELWVNIILYYTFINYSNSSINDK